MMAGLLDYGFQVPQEYQDAWSKLSPAIPYLQKMLNPAMALGNTVAGEIPKFISGPQQGLPQSQFDERFGAMPQQAPQQAQMPAQQMPPAQDMFNMPTGSYQFGQQMVPSFGQPQAPQGVDEASAQRRTGSLQINPQGNPVTPAAVAPGATDSGQDKWMEALDRLSPDYVSRYRQTKQQQKSAQALATFFQGQGMAPQQAAAMAAVASANPKIMEEFFKQPATVEGALARDMAFGTGGGGSGGARAKALDWKRDSKAADAAGEVLGKTTTEAQINLPGGVADVNETMSRIKELRGHKGRNSLGWHGVTANIPPEMLRGTDAFGAIKLQDQLRSRTFTDQVKTMVGMGALSNAEGEKITDAVNRLDRGLKREEYDRALDDIEATLRIGVDKMHQKAGKAAPFGFQGGGWGQLPGGARFKKVSD